MEVLKKVDHCLGPIELSSMLNSVACSLTVNRSDPISIYHLVMEARNFAATLWSSGTFQFNSVDGLVSITLFFSSILAVLLCGT